MGLVSCEDSADMADSEGGRWRRGTALPVFGLGELAAGSGEKENEGWCAFRSVERKTKGSEGLSGGG